MRNIDRIYPCTTEIAELWRTKCPDWRFGQLMMNFLSWHYTHYKSDVFYLEEDTFIKRLAEYLNEW